MRSKVMICVLKHVVLYRMYMYSSYLRIPLYTQPLKAYSVKNRLKDFKLFWFSELDINKNEINNSE